MKPNHALLIVLGVSWSFLVHAEERWKVIDEGFKLKVPIDWKKQKLQPIDSNAGAYKSARADLEFDELFGLGYTTNKSQSAINELRKKEANPKLLKPGEEVWRVQGRLASFRCGKVDPKVYGHRRFTNVAGLFIPYEGKAGYLSIDVLYKSEQDLPTVRRVLQSVDWKPKKPNNANAPNAAMTPWLHAEHHWRGVGDLRRFNRS